MFPKRFLSLYECASLFLSLSGSEKENEEKYYKIKWNVFNKNAFDFATDVCRMGRCREISKIVSIEGL